LIAVILRFALQDEFDGRAPFMLSTLAVGIAAFAGGFLPGLVATVVSIVFGSFLFVTPEQRDAQWTGADTVMVFSTAVVWIGISLICGKMRDLAIQNSKLLTERDDERLRLAATVDAMSDGFLSFDGRGHVARWNPQMLSVLRRDSFEDGATIDDLLASVNSPALSGALAEARAQRKSVRVDVPFGEGGKWMHVSIDPVGRGDFSLFCQDISDRKELELSQARMLAFERSARSSAEQANRLKDEFLATLSHELRTPLTTLLGWIELLEAKEKLSGTMAEGFDAIKRSANRLTKLIDDLLDLSRINAGKIKLDFRHVNAADVVIEAVEAAQPLAKTKGLTLRADIRSHDVMVRGDAGRLHQIFANLINNAKKFTPEGGEVTVTIDREPEACVVSITDTGEGIAPEFLPLIFERFRQADATIGRRHEGLGLGLAIVRQLVELHGGSISAVSDGLGKGSTFTVRIPVAVVGQRNPLPRRKRRVEVGPGSLSGLKVLIVDDDNETREFLRIVLQDLGAEVETASDGREALARLQNSLPDVLVSDIGMPEMDGYQLIRKVRDEISDGLALPAVALTAFAREEDRSLAMESGFQAHLTKPVKAIALGQVILDVLAESVAE